VPGALLPRTRPGLPLEQKVPCNPADLHERASRIRLLLFDVDGVLTDGALILHADGSESKRFDIKDGAGIVLAHRAGLVTGLLSARRSAATTLRAAQLGIRIVRQEVSDKLDAYSAILEAEHFVDAEVAYMGDDLLDLPVMARAGLSAAPADAADDVRARACWVSSIGGGRGAVRELVEIVLRAQGRWDDLIRPYAEGGAC
jgi:3-deoxy-D-manno-octulosonate 8-phosphate phosphatase (KDO 8-P phosphatase)